MIRTDVLVLGGGLAGLSAAYHLRKLGGGKTRALVVEKEARAGGRAGSIAKDGFLFDHTGHLLHLHDPYGKKLILDLLGRNVALHERSTWIHSQGAFTRYPFQANTYGLPPEVVAECVAGFMKNRYRPRPLRPGASFGEWCRATFGMGIYKRFMEPYNRKLWLRPLDELTTEWQGRFLPRPSAEEVVYGALTDQKKFFGYNAWFRYPVRGGTQALPDALAARVEDLRTGCRVESVDLRERTAVVTGLGEVRFEKLVNTMPLPDFLDLCDGVAPAVRAARRKLRWISVHNLNIGIARANVSKKHWIYFPEKRFPFYRAGFCGNFSRHLCPPGTSSMYIEIARRPGEKADYGRLERQCVDALRSCGLLRSSDKLATRLWIPIETAYVVYDRDRTPAVRRILPWLEKRGVHSIGRWGGWKYSFMEETILDGKRCAEALLGRKPEEGPESQAPLRVLK